MRIQHILLAVGLAASALHAQETVKIDEHGARAIAIGDNGTLAPRPKATPGGLDTLQWEALGPYGGDVYGIAASPTNPNIVLAGLAPNGSSGGSLYRSTDGGSSWTIVSSMSTLSVFDVEFAPNGTAFVGTMDGVWRSTNDGVSWTSLPLNIGLNDQTFEVTIDPSNPNFIYAGIADALGSQTQLVLKSIDGGTSWSNATPPLSTLQNCRAIAVHPTSPNIIGAAFGGSFGGGQVWISTDGGFTWQNRSAGLPNTPAATIVHDGTRFLVGGGQLFGSQFFGLFASSNNGATWTPLHNASWPTLIVSKIALDPNDAGNIFLSTVQGIFRSTNGGSTWQFGVGGTSFSANTVRFAPGSSSNIYVGASSVGVYRSTDGGTSFAQSSFGIGALDVYSIAANPNDNSELALCFQSLNSGGVYRSTDSGQTWVLQSAPPVRYNTVGYAPNGTLYAISDGPTGSFQEALYRRNPDGTWTHLGPNQGSLYEAELFALRFSINNPNLIYTGGTDFGTTFGFRTTIWRSLDAGQTWTKVYHGPNDSRPTMDIEIIEDGTDQKLVASYRDNSGNRMGGVLVSSDSGSTWTPATAGLPTIIQPNSVAPVAGSPSTFLLSNSDNPLGGPAGGGLFRSLDGGSTWTATGHAAATKYIATDPTDAQVVYSVQYGSGGVQDRIHRSQDGGVTFSLFSDNLPAQAGFASALVYAPGASPKLLYSTNKGTFALSFGGACYANCDGSTTQPILNVADFGCFLSKFAAGDAYANCDGSTTQPVLNVADFGCFLSKFAGGCP